ncbi:CHAP domain-containing protein [candidate division WS5 bacterium]|uniref:CHAP domain-containing protein n=1 Tax=candidate division WS5 bacterium TaxID=2093353 RepID=A0A419DEN1_9BACT|nr:MAG: CHAP domain-containing protein [candidate division WS5 bacterium]
MGLLRKHLLLSIILGLIIGVVCFLPLKSNISSMHSLIKWTGFGGYCTDWAYARWGEAHPGKELKVNGNAWEWYGYASSHGMPTGSAPQVGSVAVWDKYVGGAADVGHVAYVEQVYSNTSFRVSEMNWGCGRYCRSERNVSLVSGIHFIYPQQQVVQCNEHDRCKGTGPDVYFIERGKKRLVPNPETRDYLNNRFGGNVKIVPDDQITRYPGGRSVPSITWHYTHDYILVKNISNNWTYIMSSGVKRYLFSYDQIDTGDGDFYYPSDVREISDSEFNSIPYGPALYWNGQLLASTISPEVYVIERNKKRLIPDLQTLLSRGYKPENIFHIPQESINPIQKGRGVPNSKWSNTADNILIKGTSNDWTYVMKGGEKRYLFNYDQVDPDDDDFYYPSDVRKLTDTEITLIPTGVPMTWDKQMIRILNKLEIYVIEKNKKRYLPNIDTLLSRGLGTEKIIDIPQGVVDMIAKGRQVPDVNWPNTHDNVLLRKNGSTDIWLMRNGFRNKLKNLTDIDPIDGDSYYESDIRQVASLQNIPVQTLELPLSLSMTKIYWASRTDYDARELSVDFLIKNTGDNDAYNVTLTGSTNNKDVVTLTVLPKVVGDIFAGQEKKITVKYRIPVSTSRFRANLSATAEDFNEYLHTYPEPK